MGHVPGFPGEPPEVDLDADDLSELGRAPHGLGREVEFGDPSAGRAHGQPKPVGVGLSLATGLHQGREIVAVDVVGPGQVVRVHDRPVFAPQPAFHAEGVDVAFLVAEEMFAGLGPTMLFGEMRRQLGLHGLDRLAVVFLRRDVGDLLPALAAGEISAFRVEQSHGRRRVSRQTHQRTNSRIELWIRFQLAGILVVAPNSGQNS